MKKYYAGLDLGGTFVKGGIVDEEGKILVKDKIPTGRERPYTEIAADMARLVKVAARRSCGGDSRASASAHPADRRRKASCLQQQPWEKGRSPRGEKNLLPVYVTNDANAAALGESFAGAAKQYGSSILVTLGTGVGGGIIIDGKLFEGNRSAGAEIGHMVIRMGGEKCTCGRKGCFEAYASATALMRDTKRAMFEHKDSLMWKLVGDPENVDGKTAFDAAKAGDEVGAQVVKNYVMYLGEGILNLVGILRPQAILLGGGVSNQGEYLLQPLRKYVNDRLYVDSDRVPLAIVRATLGNDAGIYGAYALAVGK